MVGHSSSSLVHFCLNNAAGSLAVCITFFFLFMVAGSDFTNTVLANFNWWMGSCQLCPAAIPKRRVIQRIALSIFFKFCKGEFGYPQIQVKDLKLINVLLSITRDPGLLLRYFLDTRSVPSSSSLPGFLVYFGVVI